jgi:hypothetical protein
MGCEAWCTLFCLVSPKWSLAIVAILKKKKERKKKIVTYEVDPWKVRKSRLF